MDRDLTAGVITELAKNTIRPVHLYKGEFDSGTLFLTDAGVDLAYDGNTYLPSQFISHSGANETAGLLINRTTVTLSGVDQSIINIIEVEDFFLRPATIYRAWLDESLTMLTDPTVLVAGVMDAPVVAADPDSGTCTVSIDIIPRFAHLRRQPGRHTNDADQQLFFPGDLGLEFVPLIPDRIQWGPGETSKLTPRPGPGRWIDRRKRG